MTEKVKKKIEVNKELDFLLLPRQTVLLTCLDKENNKTNIITIAWATPVSHNPLIVAVAISPRRYSHNLVKDAKEFVINIPDINQAEDSNWCGRKSGSKYDKFEQTIGRPQAIYSNSFNGEVYFSPIFVLLLGIIAIVELCIILNKSV